MGQIGGKVRIDRMLAVAGAALILAGGGFFALRGSGPEAMPNLATMEEIDVFPIPCPQGMVIRALYNVPGTSDEWAEYVAFYTSLKAYKDKTPRIVSVFKTDTGGGLLGILEDKDADGTVDAKYTKENIDKTYATVCAIQDK